MEMTTHFNPLLVAASFMMIMFAAYVALNLSQNAVGASRLAKFVWLSSGAIVMGAGLWSMHFIGMLACSISGMQMAYDIPLMILSMVFAISASALAFYLLSRSSISKALFYSAGVAMAGAVAGMHYLGMHSMRMNATIQWNYAIVALSLIIALIACFAALQIFARLQNHPKRIVLLVLASAVLAVASSGMHYTGMWAATFVHTEDNRVIVPGNLLVSDHLTIYVIAITLGIFALFLAGSFIERRMHASRSKDEELLHKSEMRFRRLVEAVTDYAIFMLDTHGNITTWNMGAERINGYRDEEVIGKHVSIFYLPEDITNRTADLELKTARESGRFVGEGQRVRKDGSTYWALVTITPIIEDDGSISGFSKVVRDITESRDLDRRQRQLNAELETAVRDRTHELQALAVQLRQVTNAVPVLIAEISREQKLLFANSTFCGWVDCRQEGIIGKAFSELLGERYEYHQQFIERALKGETVSFEKKSRSNSTGEVANLNATYVPEIDSNGNVIGTILVATDVSHYKEIQAELEQSKSSAEEANRAKSAFLANMSHEIRTPLGAVLGFAELIVNEKLSDADRAKALEVIKRNGKLLSNIINDILDLSKVEAGKLEVEKAEVPFTDIMKEIGSVLNLEAIEKGLDLVVTTEGVVPSHISTDPLRLRQILVNLVGNAIKFTERGAVHVKIKLAKSDKFKLAFVITDTGTGIDPEQAKRLFKPFSQADVSTTRRFGGTGLGLVLSRKLAQALGGDVELTASIPGKGSTFTLTIDPGETEQLVFKSAPPTETKIVPLHTERPVSLKGVKILLVEDSRDNQQLIRRFLGFAGAEVDLANNGREGVEAALAGDHTLVLMDLQMPEMDGYEATRKLREAGFKKPILALTAHAMKEERERSLASGFDDHITKPIDQKALLKTLSTYASFESDSEVKQ